MLKGIKKRFSSNRTNARNRQRGSPGREQGEVPPREPPDRGGYKPTSPRQIHPVGHSVPYARRSLERRTGSPASKNSPLIYDKRPPDTFCGSPKAPPHGQLIPTAYPTSPNICVTGGKIEFIQQTERFSEPPMQTTPLISTSPARPPHSASTVAANVEKPSVVPPLNKSPPPPPLPPHRTTIEQVDGKRLPTFGSSKKSQQQALPNEVSMPATSEQANPSPTSTSRKSSSGRRSRLGRRNLGPRVAKNYLNSSGVGGSLNLRNKQESLQVRRSATMPECDDTVKELEKLRKENKYVKYQLETLKKKFVKLEDENELLAREKASLLHEKEDKEECLEKLSQYQVAVNLLEGQLKDGELKRAKCGYSRRGGKKKSLIDRCSALEYANSQLQAESQVQQHQYETCLDQVASQVVQAILVQKKQQDECERLSKQVEDLQKHNNNLSLLIRDKDGYGGGVSLTLNNPRTKGFPFLGCATLASQSLSLPSTLSRKGNICDNSEKTDNIPLEPLEPGKVSSFSPLKAQRTCSNTIEPPARSSSISKPNKSQEYKDNKATSLDNSSVSRLKGSSSACWYDIIKSLQTGEAPPPELIEHSSIGSSDSSGDIEEQSLHVQRCLLNDDSSVNSSEEECTACSLSAAKALACGVVLSNTSDTLAGSCLQCQSSQCSHSSSFMPSTSQEQDKIDAWSPAQEVVPNGDSEDAKLPTEDITRASSSSGEILPSNTSDEPNTSIKSESNSSPEVSTKDEGYSTMSSDVQTEAKDSIVVCKISTVEEEKIKPVETDDDTCDTLHSEDKATLHSSSCSIIDASNKKSNLSSHPASSIMNASSEYCDGLRIVYDEEDDGSDVFTIPIKDEKNFRHSFNIPHSCTTIRLNRSHSDSYLCTNRASSLNPANRQNLEQTTLPSLSSLKKCPDYIFNSNLCKVIRRYPNKVYKLYNKPLVSLLKASSEIIKNGNLLHLRNLSPSYSHAEMEDWSLDLSAEDIGTLGETDPSTGDSTVPLHHLSQPSIQEATLELEEDTSEFLWNGATYFKPQDHELDWHYEKDLNLMVKGQQQSLISPKSGCSDQPAIWSSSDQLSCCSDIASKCSTDIENFCEQLCNLPELKRVSFCSSENGRPESINSLSKLSEIESLEDNELIDDLAGIDTVFTRDFYRLVKYESTKSLAASSKSLAMSEGLLTMDRIQGLEPYQPNKALTSVLGFIAEQQQYCKEREALDETSLSLICNKINIHDNIPANQSFTNVLEQLHSSNISKLNNNEGDSKEIICQQKMLSSSESLSCLNLDSERTTSEDLSDDDVRLPPRPKRSTSLNLGAGKNVFRQRRALPPLPSDDSPSPPSRSTSKPARSSTIPCRSSWFSQRIPEETFPPPPTYEEIYNQSCDTLPPAIPPHGPATPSLPKRTFSIMRSKACDSPPVPKRITSRALPMPPSTVSSLVADFSNNSHCTIPTQSLSLGNKVKHTDHNKRRPHSLLKEATVANAAKKKNRGSCGELGSACRSSATLLFELQKMAEAEEEEGGNRQVARSPEVASPNHEVGLGTGWVKVEPLTDLNDPQARANLLDSMMNSSEGCSSETDEDLTKHLQHNHLMKAVQRNRRRRKVLPHNYSRNASWSSAYPRPTILDRPGMFTRYGCEEEKALQEFEFLHSLQSHSDELLHLEPRRSFPNVSHSPSPDFPYCPNNSLMYKMDLTDLPSSEPCHSEDYPINSVPALNNVLPQHYPSNSYFVSDDRQSCSRAEFCHKDLDPQDPNMISSYADRNGDSSVTQSDLSHHPSIQQHSPEHSSYSLNFNIDDVSLDLHPIHGHLSLGQSFISPIEESNSDSNFSDDLKVRQAQLLTSKPTHSSIPIKYKAETSVFVKSSDPTEVEHDYRIDTRSLCNVKAAIQKFNANSKSRQSSATKNNQDTSSFNQIPKLVRNDFQNSELLRNNLCKHNNISPSKRKPINKVSSSPTKIKSPSNLSSKSKFAKKVLAPPPKTTTTTTSPISKRNVSKGLLVSTGNVPLKAVQTRGIYGKTKCKKSAHSKKLFGGSRKKGNCDTASSDGSDNGGTSGRISISDSCAELFSPLDSGDDIYQK